MSAELLEELKKDVAQFDGQVTSLTDRRTKLQEEITQVDAEIAQIEPNRRYALNLLERIKVPVATVSRTAAATAARKQQAEERRQRAQQSPND